MNKLKSFALTILSVLVALLAIFGWGRESGKRAIESKQQQQFKKTMQEVKKIENDINALSDHDVRTRLRDKWTR